MKKAKKGKKILNKIDFMPCLGFFFFCRFVEKLKKKENIYSGRARDLEKEKLF